MALSSGSRLITGTVSQLVAATPKRTLISSATRAFSVAAYRCKESQESIDTFTDLRVRHHWIIAQRSPTDTE